MKHVSNWALNIAAMRGASYADVRVVAQRSRALTTKNGKVGSASDAESVGMSVRAIAHWPSHAAQPCGAARDYSLHGPGATVEADANRGDREGLGYVFRLHRGSRRNLSRLLSRTGVPSPGAGLVGWKADDRVDGRRIAQQPPAVQPAAADGATADRALLPDRRALGNERAKPVWSATGRSSSVLAACAGPG